MSTFVKICGLTEADDVNAAIDAGADAIGFVFAESTRRIGAQRAAEISRAVPEGVLRVAVMLKPTPQEWQAVADVFRPDVLQTDAGDFSSLDLADDVSRWPVYREGGIAPAAGHAGDTFVYEGKASGRGQTVDWQRAARVAGAGRMILAGGLGPDNVAQAIRAVRPYGVDASSSLERSPRRKDRARMAAFVSAAKRVRFD